MRADAALALELGERAYAIAVIETMEWVEPLWWLLEQPYRPWLRQLDTATPSHTVWGAELRAATLAA